MLLSHFREVVITHSSPCIGQTEQHIQPVEINGSSFSETVVMAKGAAVRVVTEVISASGMMSETEARQHIEIIKSHFDDITALLLELDDRRGWEALNYRSMHQMIQAELKDYLKKSVSQIYRLLNDAKIRRKLSHACEKIEAIPQRQLEPLGKLMPEQWRDTWEEVISTAPDGEITRQHVQAVVNLRLKSHKSKTDSQDSNFKQVLLRLGDWVEVHSTQSCNEWDSLRGPIVELEDDDGRFGIDLSGASGQPEWSCLRFKVQELIKVPAPPPYKVSDVVVIDIDHREAASPQEKKWNGFWGIVTQIGELGSLAVNVGSESLRLFSRDLKPIDAPSSQLRDVAWRLLRLRSLELDEIEQRMLDVLQRREWFTSKQLVHLDHLESLYRLTNSVQAEEQQPVLCRSP